MRGSKNDGKAEGTVTTRLREDDIIETVYSGYVSASMARDVEIELAKLLRTHPNANWLIDATQATGVEVASGESRMAVFDLFKGKGGKIAVVTNTTAIRMMVATFAFAFRVPMKAFEGHREALEFLRGRHD